MSFCYVYDPYRTVLVFGRRILSYSDQAQSYIMVSQLIKQAIKNKNTLVFALV